MQKRDARRLIATRAIDPMDGRSDAVAARTALVLKVNARAGMAESEGAPPFFQRRATLALVIVCPAESARPR